MEVICDVLTQDAQRLHLGDTVIYSSVGTPVVLKGKVKKVIVVKNKLVNIVI